MENDGIKAMSNILDNSRNISKEIRNEVYKLLGLNTESEHLSEYVKECLEKFNFNLEETKFLEQLRIITNEEINIINEQIKNNEQVNYEMFESKLIERFRTIERPDINIDDNIRDLARQIVNRFPQINVSSNQLYNHFISKKEKIIETINQYNKTIVEALIKITPQLAKDLESSFNAINNPSIHPETSTTENVYGTQDNQKIVDQHKKTNSLEQENSIKRDLVNQIINAMNKAGEMKWGEISFDERINRVNNIRKGLYSKTIEDLQLLLATYTIPAKENNDSYISKSTQSHGVDIAQEIPKMEQSVSLKVNDEVIFKFREKCMQKANELKEMYRQVVNSNPDLAKQYSKVIGELIKLYGDTEDKIFAQGILNKYMKLNEMIQESVYDEIIYHNIPMLKDIFQKNNNIIFETPRTPEKITPDAPHPVSTYIGATNDEVEELIKQNKYFPLLQGIKKEDIGKYNGFIFTGYNILMDNWFKKATVCKTFEEKHNSYFELYEIYQNFRDYLPLEQVNQLREQLDDIKNYLNKQRKTNIDDYGIRYNTKDEKKSTSMHR